MNFNYFLNKYYLPSQLDQLKGFLKETHMYNPIKETIAEFYKEAEANSIEDLNTQLILTISDFTCCVNNFLKEIPNPDQKKKYQIILTELGIYLIRETYKISGYSKEKYFKIVKSTLRKIYLKHKWDFDELDRLLHLDTIEKFAEENKIHLKDAKDVVTKSIFIEWKGKGHLDFFIADFKSFFKAKNSKAVQYLFQPVITQFEIHIVPERLPHVLLLFDILHKEKIIKVRGSRGIYNHLENHLRPAKGSFPGREFRKIKYEISQNERLYKEIESRVQSTFGKYYSNGR